jgi:hypothetical protein
MVVRMVRALPFQMALRIRKPRLGFAGTATAKLLEAERRALMRVVHCPPIGY